MGDFNIVEVDADPFSIDRDKIVGLSFAKEAVAATTYYMGIDISNDAQFPHEAGAGIILARAIAKAAKTNAGGEWRAQLLVVLRINGTDSDLAVLAQASINLQDTSVLSVPEQIVDLWPHFSDLTVVSNDFPKLLTNTKELAVTAINTGTDLEDAKGNLTVKPAEGDLLIRAELLGGGGTFSFAFGLAYFVE